MLFLRRGMWGWARTAAMATASVSQQPNCSPSLNRMATDEYRAVIHVFAAMAMNADSQEGAL
jgi:hypothetical protein